ncbi:MAG TPA: AAA family ATPase, partial [Alicycliphilus sp.]|nr:AAA family ATPase [Alicycliphilus sp.]
MRASDSIPPSYTWDQLAAKLGLPTRLPSKQLQRAPLKRTVLSNESIDSLLHTPCNDGERTEHLTTLIGKLLAAKHGPDEALALCHQWNQQNHEPLDDDKIESTFASILASDQRNHPERYQAQLPLAPLFPLDKGHIDHYISTDPPPRRWLVNDTIVLGKAGAIVAPGGSSKSQWLLQLAVGVATGLPVANHWQVSQPGNVLVFCAEDDDDEIHRRLKRITDQLRLDGHDPAALGIADRLRVFSTIGQETLL